MGDGDRDEQDHAVNTGSTYVGAPRRTCRCCGGEVDARKVPRVVVAGRIPWHEEGSGECREQERRIESAL